MPELPEVETIRRDLSKSILRHTITAIEIRDQKTVKNSVKFFISELVGNKILKIERRGKLLMLKLAKGGYLLIHLKMTGQLIYRGKNKIVAGGHSLNSAADSSERFTRVIIKFNDGAKLFFNDLRRFGYLKIVDDKEKEAVVKNSFGIEPLTTNFTWESFSLLFKKRATTIKAFLLNQKLISGLGNIYADEACYCAGVKPNRRVGKVTLAEQKKFFSCIPKILNLAIKNRGTTFYSFVDGTGERGSHLDFLKVYNRAGKKCKRCNSIIQKTKLAGRGTHFCSQCQK